MKDKIINALSERIKEAEMWGNRHFLLGLDDAINIVEGVYLEQEKNQCVDCGKEEKNPGLDVCGPCYHRRIWGDH